MTDQGKYYGQSLRIIVADQLKKKELNKEFSLTELVADLCENNYNSYQKRRLKIRIKRIINSYETAEKIATEVKLSESRRSTTFITIKKAI